MAYLRLTMGSKAMAIAGKGGQLRLGGATAQQSRDFSRQRWQKRVKMNQQVAEPTRGNLRTKHRQMKSLEAAGEAGWRVDVLASLPA